MALTYTSGKPLPPRLEYVNSGTYEAVVVHAEETVAKSGSEMIALRLDIQMPEGSKDAGPLVFDNLVFTESSGWKIDQFRAAVGERVVEGEEVEIDPDKYIEARVKVRLKVEVKEGKKRNAVSGYVAKPADEDDVPF